MGRLAIQRREEEGRCERSSKPEVGKGPPAKGRYRVRVCVDSNELFVEELAAPHRRVFHSLVVTGGEGTPTPLGRFRLGPWEADYTTPRWGAKACTPWSKRPGFNVFGPYIVRFKGGYFLHGTLFPGAFSIPWINLASAFGGSHGCVRMNNVDLVMLHDDILGNPKGTAIIIENCASPAEATGELRLAWPALSLTSSEGAGEEGAAGAVTLEYRRFTPPLLDRRLQPFVGATLSTEAIGLQAGATLEPMRGIGLYLEGRAALRTEWFDRVEVGAGAEVGMALTRSRSIRLGVGWDVWQSLSDNERRQVLSVTLGFRH